MPYIAPEMIEEVKRMDLLTYLQQYEPQELVHFSGKTYTTRTHDSLKISNGKWNWWSQSIGGRSALDYLIKVRGYSFVEAVEQLASRMPSIPVMPPIEVPKPRRLLLPPANADQQRVVKYLKDRGIAERIIESCITSGRLYESRDYHNVVFVGMDKQEEPKYAALRGTYHSDYKGEATGSDKHFSFSIPAKGKSRRLHVFESPIDLLSFGTLRLLQHEEWNKEHLLSLSGVFCSKKAPEEQKLPVSLQQYLIDHPDIKYVELHLDKDRAGRGAADSIVRLLKGAYDVRDVLPEWGKDVNDTLCKKLNLPFTQKKEKER